MSRGDCGNVPMMPTDRDSVLAIVASLFVLFSAMINPALTIALVLFALIALAIQRLAGRAAPR